VPIEWAEDASILRWALVGVDIEEQRIERLVRDEIWLTWQEMGMCNPVHER
jgi:hypothetical protein